MKTIFYNNNLAKVFYTLTGSKSLSIGPVILTSLNEKELGLRTYNHLTTHVRQWIEVTLVSFIIILTGIIDLGISSFTILLSPVIYYILNAFEYLIRWFLRRSGLVIFIDYSATRTSFEQEAMVAENDPNYHDEFHLFTWVKYII
jgi:hypothetical protein